MDWGSVFCPSPLLASCVASVKGFVWMACKKKIMLFLTKTPLQLNCNLHDILMTLQVKSDSCQRSGERIFSQEETT